MERWELTACLIAYAEKETAASKERLIRAWQAGLFTNQAFNGTLKDLAYYTGEATGGTGKAPEPISRAEFDAGLARAEAQAKQLKQ